MKKYFNILSVFLIVLVCFLTLTGCKSGVKVKDDGGDMLIQTTEERGIHLSRRNVKNVDGSYTLQATIIPADATNKKLTWSLDVAQEYEDLNDFISDNNMYQLDEYIQLTVSSDTLSCSVKKLDVCPVQLKIVVTSQADSSVSATCTVDFYRVIDSVVINNFVFSAEDKEFSPDLDYGIIDFSNTGITYSEFLENDAAISVFDFTATYKGTVSPTVTDLYTKISLHQSFINKLKELGYTDANENFEMIDFNSAYFSFSNLFSRFCDIEDERVIQTIKTSDYIFNITFSYRSEIDGEDYLVMDPVIEYSVGGFDFSDVSVLSVELDENSIIFK